MFIIKNYKKKITVNHGEFNIYMNELIIYNEFIIYKRIEFRIYSVIFLT